ELRNIYSVQSESLYVALPPTGVCLSVKAQLDKPKENQIIRFYEHWQKKANFCAERYQNETASSHDLFSQRQPRHLCDRGGAQFLRAAWSRLLPRSDFRDRAV